MITEESGFNFDPKYEDPEKLKALSRRDGPSVHDRKGRRKAADARRPPPGTR